MALLNLFGKKDRRSLVQRCMWSSVKMQALLVLASAVTPAVLGLDAPSSLAMRVMLLLMALAHGSHAQLDLRLRILACEVETLQGGKR